MLHASSMMMLHVFFPVSTDVPKLIYPCEKRDVLNTKLELRLVNQRRGSDELS
jgi:hypothetical protein